MNPRIVDAIKSKRRITLRYYGYNRVVEPFAYGLDDTGDALLLAYQIHGTGRGARDAGWLSLRLYEVVTVCDTDETFVSNRPGYRRNDPIFCTVFEQL